MLKKKKVHLTKCEQSASDMDFQALDKSNIPLLEKFSQKGTKTGTFPTRHSEFPDGSMLIKKKKYCNGSSKSSTEAILNCNGAMIVQIIYKNACVCEFVSGISSN